ncbi:hypothetical protein J4E85_006565 [Alternaria conjuncta]|uniref:uncharacterized protein n=1 Tax=Alternaria conjuncta TaxID=181017 RepID=UPI002220D24E|nr:uncharacterized protein J4E85_006565 [Alternaria conjuncta]KAI4926273.1 hypothetical protein J4E85_006565 [Alternaria conjuncta]
MQFSTTFLALCSAFVASSAAQGTLSFTISTCAACSTASGCLIEGSTNLPANRCISIYDGNKSLIITEAANPNCKINLHTSFDCTDEAPEVFSEVGVCEAYGPKNSYKITC